MWVCRYILRSFLFLHQHKEYRYAGSREVRWCKEGGGGGGRCWPGSPWRSDHFPEAQAFGCHKYFAFFRIGFRIFSVSGNNGSYWFSYFIRIFLGKIREKYEKNTKKYETPGGGQCQIHGSKIQKKYGADGLLPPTMARAGLGWAAGAAGGEGRVGLGWAGWGLGAGLAGLPCHMAIFETCRWQVWYVAGSLTLSINRNSHQ